jgi:hypothetical protein
MRRLYARFSLSYQDMRGWRTRYFNTVIFVIFCCLPFACAAVLILFQLVHEKQLVQCRRWGMWVRWFIVFLNNTLTFVVVPYAATGKLGIGIRPAQAYFVRGN